MDRLNNDLDGWGKLLKYSLFIFNFIIVIFGLLIIGLGVRALVDKSYAAHLMESNTYVTSATILMVMGAFVAVIAFMGCCGALYEIKWLLLLFFVIILLIFIIFLVGAIMVVVMRRQVDDFLQQRMNTTIKQYDTEEKYKDVTKAWDNTQSKLKCCGIHDHKSWSANEKFQGGRVPQSCCKDPKPGCGNLPTPATVFEQGCYKKVGELAKKNARVLAAVTITIALVMILAMVTSCCLYSRL